MEPGYQKLIHSGWHTEPLNGHRLDARERRAAFRTWLEAHRDQIGRMSLSDILSKYGRTISLPAAYRIAVSAGIRGKRRNTSRYDAFWATINWRLPDSTLSAVWAVTRGNIRQRRVRLRATAAAYAVHADRLNPRFQQELAAEKRRARNFPKLIPR